ncbi:MAG TPA: cytosine permease [Ktedonobacterales bacterium]|jgi:NCS1 nucleoside transporter family
MAVTTEQQSTTFEVTGIERVTEDNRQHTQLWDTMWLWWSANSVVATVALGTLSAFFGLGFWGSVLVIVIFNVLGVLPVAFLSTLGPKTGLAQMPLSRFAFGLQGARLPAIFNALACIGWSAVNALIGSQIIVTWSAEAIPQWAALLFLAIVTTVVSVFGYFIVHRYERFAWILMFILFGYVFIASAGKFNLDAVGAGALGDGLLLFSGIATFGGAILGYAIGWSSYSADYTRRQPANTPANKVFWYAFSGVVVPCILLETLGVLLATAATGDTAGALIANAIGTGGIGGLVVVLLAFSTIANNVPNDYSFALSTQVLGLKNIRRWILTIVGAVAYVALAFFFLGSNFNAKLEGFLLVIAYWLGAWNAVVLLEHFVFRKGKYPVEDYETSSKLPVGIAAIAAMVIGLGVAALGVNQAATFGYEGVLSPKIGDADIGFPLAIVVTGVLYYFLRRWELSKYKR